MTSTETSKVYYVNQDIMSRVPNPSRVGYHNIGVVLITNPEIIGEGYLTEFYALFRVKSNTSHLIMQTPVITDSIDKSGTFTFSVLNDGTATANELAFLNEKVFVLVVMGGVIVFSGIIRRVTQNTQNGYVNENQVQIWDIECDSDLMKLKKQTVAPGSASASGTSVIGSPGEILKRILSPTTSGVWGSTAADDLIGIVNEVDQKLSYQLSPSNDTEGAGSRYEHVMALHQLTNYDLRTRPVVKNYIYSSYETQ
jgi:hypothetical protein